MRNYIILENANTNNNEYKWEQNSMLYLTQKGVIMREFDEMGDERVETARGTFKILYANNTDEIITQ